MTRAFDRSTVLRADATSTSAPARRPRRAVRHLTLFLALVMAAWLLHWHTFGSAELGVDGYLSVDLGSGPLGAMVAFTARDVHPPLFFALLHVWFGLVGASYATAKFVPIAGATLALAVSYRLVTLLLGPWRGLLATALLALSSEYLLLSPTVRPFTMALALSLLTLLATVRLTVGSTGRDTAGVLLLAISTAAALLTWYLQLFFVLLEVLLLLTSAADAAAWNLALATAEPGSRRIPAVGWPLRCVMAPLAALGIGALLALPWYVYVVPRLVGKLIQGSSAGNAAPRLPSFATAAASLAKALVGSAHDPLDAAATVGWLVALTLGVAACLTHSRVHDRRLPGAASLAPVSRAAGAADRDALPVSPLTSPRRKRDSVSKLAAAQDAYPHPGVPTAPLDPGSADIALTELPSGTTSAADALARRVLLWGLVLGFLSVAAIMLRWQHPDAFSRYLLAVLPFAVALQSLAMTRASGACSPELPPVRWSRPRPSQTWRPSDRAWRVVAVAGVAVALAGQLRWYTGLVTSVPIDWANQPDFAYVTAHARRGDVALFSDRARRAQYRLGGGQLPTAVIQTSGNAYLHTSARQADATVAMLARHASRIWYLESGEQGAAARVGRVALAARVFEQWHQPIGGSDLQRYQTAIPNVERQLGLTLPGAATLASASYSDLVQPGGELDVRLIWRDDRPLSSAYTVFVHLDDQKGQLVAQHDGPPGTGLYPTTGWRPGEVVDDLHGISLPPHLPPGTYRLNVGLYRGQQRLALPDGTNALQLGSVRVRP